MTEYRHLINTLRKTSPRKLNDHILIIDAMNTLIRSFSLLKAINPSGHHVGGLVGFLRSLGFVTRSFDPTRVIVVWDGKGGAGNRQNINPDYKAQRANARITNWGIYDTREEEREALISQLYRTQDYLDCLPVHQIGLEKLEADDIIAYLALQGSAKNKKVTIVSSDKDFLQLVDNNIEVYAPVKKITFTKDNITEQLKVIPENYNIVKALLGDNSDNLKGVKGLGLKTIIKEFPEIVSKPLGSLDYIYEICEQNLESKKVFANILYSWDKIETNFKLMNLHDTVLDDKEKAHILEIISSPIPNLQTGAFLHLLDQDKIEGITKNTEGWLSTFSELARLGKQ